MDIIKEYPIPWKLVKEERMNYYRVESADDQYIMWGNDSRILKFIIYHANKNFHSIPADIVRDILERFEY